MTNSEAQLINAADCFALPSGTAAYWSFDGHTRDVVGTNDGTVVGSPFYTSGLAAGCGMVFGGSCLGENEDLGRVAHSPELSFDNQPMSWSIWVAPMDQNEGHIFGKRIPDCRANVFNYQLVYHNWMPGIGWAGFLNAELPLRRGHTWPARSTG